MGIEREQDLVRQLYELHSKLTQEHTRALEAIRRAMQAMQQSHDHLQEICRRINAAIVDDMDDRRTGHDD